MNAVFSGIRSSIVLGIIIFLFIAGSSGIIAQPTVTTDKIVYVLHQPITITFADGPGDPTDMIGIYRAGASSSNPINWFYVNGTRTPGLGLRSGLILFTGLPDTGSYEARFYQNNSNQLLAETGFAVRTSPPSVTTDKVVYSPGQPIAVNFANGPGYPADWIGLYWYGSPAHGSIGWYYVDGTNYPGAALQNGTVTFPAGLPGIGTYEARFYFNDGYTLLAQTELTVLNSQPSVTSNSGLYNKGGAITITFTNGPGNASDWVGLYTVGSPSSPAIDWLYVGGTKTPGLALQNGTLTFSAGLYDIGSYEARFYLSNGYNLMSKTGFIVNSQFTAMPDPFPGLTESSIDWGDYDNDGHLDVIVTGLNSVDSSVSKIYHNNGDGTFTETSSLAGVWKGAAVWGDYNNDAYLDILLTGTSTTGLGAITKIYKNNGDGTFTEQTSTSLPPLQYSSAAWGDYNDDGYLDFLLAGYDIQLGHAVTYIYKNNGNGTFTRLNLNLPGIDFGTVAWGDFNNDGFPDFALVGNNYTRIYINYSGTGSFGTAVYFSPPLLNGKAAWGDYNNDGNLDILISGSDGVHTYTWLEKGSGNGSFTQQAFFNGLGGVVDGKIMWGDYNNDGYLDILMTGIDSTNNNVHPTTKLIRNNRDGTFSEDNSSSLAQLSLNSASFGDYNGDGNIDFLLMGDSSGVKTAKLYKNNYPTPHINPNSPTNLSAAVHGEAIIFDWSKSTFNGAPQNGFNYNLDLGTSPGAINSLSPMSNRSSGYRRIVQMGNSRSTSNTIFHLPDGTYYWSVQAIDQAFAGSPFPAEQSIIISNAGSAKTKTKFK